MGFGIGVIFIAIGLIILLGAVTIPDSVSQYADAHLIGVILVVVGVLAIVIGLLQSRSRRGPDDL